MRDYTPTTGQVRDAYRLWHRTLAEPVAEFDRWLTAHDAEREKAMRERIAQDIEAAALNAQRADKEEHGAVSAMTALQMAGMSDAARIAREGVAP